MLANQEQSQELSLEGICQVLLYQLQNQKHTLSSQQENCQKEISQKEKLIYDIEQNHKILNYTFSYHLAMLDARDIRQQITQNRAEYEDFSKAYIDGEQQLIDKKLSQLSLERFSVLHYLQKKQLQKELYELEQSCREYQQEMQRLDSCLRVYQRQWEQICRKFQKETGYDIHQFANVVRKAKRFISQHADILEERCQVDELKLELSKIQVELAELEPVLRKYSTEHHLFQK